MRHRTTLSRSALAVTLLVAASCSSRGGGNGARGQDSPLPTAVGAAEGSIFDLDLSLVDQHGQHVQLAALKGRPMVAAMMYTTCNSVCPRVTEDMKAIERQLTDRDRQGVTFVLFSLDPGRDTPEALRKFGTEHGLDQSRWRLLAASEDGVRELAAVLGVKYRRDANDEIAHSAMIFVIDGEGVVRHSQEGLAESPRALIDALARTRF